MSATRRNAGVATLVLAIAGGVFWLGRGRTSAQPTSALDALPTKVAGESPRAAPIGSEGAASNSASRARDAAEDTASTEEDDASEPDADGMPEGAERDRIFPIDGTVVVTDAMGKETVDADGELLIYGPNSDTPWQEVVAVTHGRFHLELAGWKVFNIEKLTLGGRPAFEDPASQWCGYYWPKAHRRLVLHVLSSRPSLVHFIDAVSGAELTNVSLFHEVDDPSDPGDANGDKRQIEEALLRGVNSPVELDARVAAGRVRWGDTLSVRTPGYAAVEIDVDYREGGSWFLPLKRAGSLSVTVVGAPPGAGLEIDEPDGDDALREAFRVQEGFDYDGIPMHWSPIESEAPIRIETLPAGKYVANVILGARVPPFHASVARREFELTAGQDLELKLTCRTIEHATRVPVAGTIEVPEEWGDPVFKLEVVPVRRPDLWADNHREISSEEMTCDAGSPRVFHWRIEGVEPATYRFRVGEFAVSIEREIGPKGSENVRLSAPRCGEVSLQIVNAETGNPIDEYSVVWESEPGPERESTRFDLRRGDASRRFEGRVPVGPGSVSGSYSEDDAIGFGLLLDERTLEVHLGKNEFTLHARPAPRLQIELTFDGWHVPWMWEMNCDITAVDHDGELVNSRDNGARTLYFSRPGRYRIELATIPGFEPVPAFEVDVAVDAGKRVVHRIELKRKL